MRQRNLRLIVPLLAELQICRCLRLPHIPFLPFAGQQ